MIGYRDDAATLYIIDFGLSKCYRDPRTKVRSVVLFDRCCRGQRLTGPVAHARCTSSTAKRSN